MNKKWISSFSHVVLSPLHNATLFRLHFWTCLCVEKYVECEGKWRRFFSLKWSKIVIFCQKISSSFRNHALNVMFLLIKFFILFKCCHRDFLKLGAGLCRKCQVALNCTGITVYVTVYMSCIILGKGKEKFPSQQLSSQVGVLSSKGKSGGAGERGGKGFCKYLPRDGRGEMGRRGRRRRMDFSCTSRVASGTDKKTKVWWSRFKE